MILYSIIPPEEIFKQKYSNDKSEMLYMGEKVEVSLNSNNEYVINRLLSTCPKSYLNPRLQPGSIIQAQ